MALLIHHENHLVAEFWQDKNIILVYCRPGLPNTAQWLAYKINEVPLITPTKIKVAINNNGTFVSTGNGYHQNNSEIEMACEIRRILSYERWPLLNEDHEVDDIVIIRINSI